MSGNRARRFRSGMGRSRIPGCRPLSLMRANTPGPAGAVTKVLRFPGGVCFEPCVNVSAATCGRIDRSVVRQRRSEDPDYPIACHPTPGHKRPPRRAAQVCSVRDRYRCVVEFPWLEACDPEFDGAGMGGTLCAQFGSAAALPFFAGPQWIWFEPVPPASSAAKAGAANIPTTATAVRRFITRIGSLP